MLTTLGRHDRHWLQLTPFERSVLDHLRSIRMAVRIIARLAIAMGSFSS
jgi:hypothetical protein